MYSDTDIDTAVAAGVLTPETAAAFRAHVAGTAATPPVDEEHFRLLSGFNDIFVTIAAVLLLLAVGWIGAAIGADVDIPSPLGGLFVAATAWGLAEFFTRQRRMALPSILLLLAFAGGVFTAVDSLLAQILAVGHNADMGPQFERGQGGLILALASASTALAAWVHWQRFRVPITVSAGVAASVGLVLALVLSGFPQLGAGVYPLLLVAGLAVFAVAMGWDISDRTRVTRRADVVFWLHLLAAPLIVHPVFHMLGLLGGGASATEALAVLLLYVALAVVALAIHRRALMVSALAYVLFALSELFKQFGAVGLNLALNALVIGAALLLLSAFWHTARRAVLGVLPTGLRVRLPVEGRAVATA